ncbi:Phosphoglucomutase [Clostridiaceae bacterium JG1575]|nr:Phosphoglucomutase [Clostridiaceae bacterium JG1575]
MDYQEVYRQWLNDEAILPEYRKELKALTDEREIEDRFYQELSFGTAGLRGVLGAGTNRMNEHTVGKATLGYARYLSQNYGRAKVVIAYDCRIKSPEFARLAARILAQEGHTVYLFRELRPVPLLSFAVRHLEADGGIVITASHNPKQYNGYKVYSGYGGQVTDEEAAEIFAKIQGIHSYADLPAMNYEAAIATGQIILIGEDVDRAYYESIKTLSVKRDLIAQHAKDLKIIYTPLHGTGNVPVRTILKEQGYEKVYVVPEQERPDGQFPTAPYPNPEDPSVFALALEMNRSIDADLIFGTDPDADRLGVLVQDASGAMRVLSGNQTGMLLTHYMLLALKQEGRLPKNAAVIKTIVSTESVQKICDHYGVTLFNVLTGFKYIGEKIEEFLQEGSYEFIFGFEESFGYSAGTFTRDKDAVVTAMLVAEMALYYKSRNMTLYDALMEVYATYGTYEEVTESYARGGRAGAEEIRRSLDFFRGLDLKEVDGVPVLIKQDFWTSREHRLDGTEHLLTLPQSNVIKFMLADDSWFVIRPSGTEPKMKAYLAVRAANAPEAHQAMERFRGVMDGWVQRSFEE